MVKNILSPTINKLTWLVDTDLIRMYTEFEREKSSEIILFFHKHTYVSLVVKITSQDELGQYFSIWNDS
jgi:hypothetical protein